MAATKKSPATPRKKAEPAFTGLPGETVEITTTRDPLSALKGWKFGNAEVVCKLDATKNTATVSHISFMGDHSLNIAELANPIHDFDLKVDAETGELKGLPTILFVAAISGKTITPSKVFVYHDDDVNEAQRRTLRRAVFNDPITVLTVGTEIDLTPPKKEAAPKKEATAKAAGSKPIAKKTPAKKAPAKASGSEAPKPRTRKAPAKAPANGTAAKKPSPRKAPAPKKAPASKAEAAPAPKPRRRTAKATA